MSRCSLRDKQAVYLGLDSSQELTWGLTLVCQTLESEFPPPTCSAWKIICILCNLWICSPGSHQFKFLYWNKTTNTSICLLSDLCLYLLSLLFPENPLFFPQSHNIAALKSKKSHAIFLLQQLFLVLLQDYLFHPES